MKKTIACIVVFFSLSPVTALGITREQQEKIDQLKSIVIKHFKKSEYSEAIPLLNEILIVNPKDTTASRYLLIANRKIVEPYCREAADAYMDGNYSDALKHWEKILEINPDDRRVMGLMENSIRILNENTLAFLYEEADNLFRDEQFELAAEQWEKILLIDPGQERAGDLLEITEKIIVDRQVKSHYEKADAYIMEEDYGRAINELKEVLKIDKNQERASSLISKLYKKMLDSMYSRAEVLYRLGNYVNARDQYYRIMAANPEDKRVKGIIDRLVGLIGVTPTIDEKGEVWDILRKGLAHHIAPDGDPEVAIVSATYGVQMEPDNNQFKAILDYLQRQHLSVLQTMGRIDNEMNVLDQYLFVALNDIYEGRYDLAIRKCKVVLGLQPDNILALKRLGSAYFALGDKRKAKATWGRALELSPGDSELKGFIRQAK